MPVAAILAISEDEVGYQWFTEEGRVRHTSSLRWSGVDSVEVFKRDLFSYDLICLRLVANNEVVVEFDEEDPRWKELMSTLPIHLPGCKRWEDWFPKVAFPAFDANLQRVFKRKNA